MLIETIARKALTIGATRLAPGDVLSDAMSNMLPPGRMKVLKDQGWLSERPVGVDNDVLVARLAVLEERVATLEARRGPGRPRRDDSG